LRAGDAVTLCYGALNNDAFLLDYGFVPRGGVLGEGEDGTSTVATFRDDAIDLNPHDSAGLRWDLGLLEAAREVAGLSATPFGVSTGATVRGRGGGATADDGAGDPFAPWQRRALAELRLERGPVGGEDGTSTVAPDQEILVRADPRSPIDHRMLAGVRVLYASKPEDLLGRGGGRGGQGEEDGTSTVATNTNTSTNANAQRATPLTQEELGDLWRSPLDRTREAYALRRVLLQTVPHTTASAW
jgi:histone-lysine N-methyltransferase SETD3